VVLDVVEVAEAREQIDDVIEAADAERRAHVLPDEAQGRAFSAARLAQAFLREIEPRDVEPSRGEVSGMPSRAAPEVEHGRACVRICRSTSVSTNRAASASFRCA
jgi:hypothetical protein